ncbi:trichohyalin-like [Boleophthalmus pectinirostris]|uniref:trichohyalin-like n=1 Tax=Boleophthalmus pectinirostris TaxID=150288 RepID=UPI00242F52FF|nr:trichohyalin-like [Boleophthalmus pectinirostris]
MDKPNNTVGCDSGLSQSLPQIDNNFRGFTCQNQGTSKRSNRAKGAGTKNKSRSKSRAKVKEQDWDFESSYMDLLGGLQEEETTDLTAPELKCPSADVSPAPSSPDGNRLKTFNSQAPEPELKHQTLSNVSAAPASVSDTRGEDQEDFYISELLQTKRAERQLKGSNFRRRQSSFIPAPLGESLQSPVCLEPEQVSNEAVKSTPEKFFKKVKPEKNFPDTSLELSPALKEDTEDSARWRNLHLEPPRGSPEEDNEFLEVSEPEFKKYDEEEDTFNYQKDSTPTEPQSSLSPPPLEELEQVSSKVEDDTAQRSLKKKEENFLGTSLVGEEIKKDTHKKKAEVHHRSVSPASSSLSDAPEPHDVATSPVTKNLETSEEFLESQKRREEEEERRLKAESEERLETLRRSLLAKRREAEARLREESEREIQALQAERERQAENIRREERRMSAENEQRLETLRRSLLAKRREAEARLREESEREIQALQAERERQAENIRREERRMSAENEQRLETLRQSLLAKRTEEEEKLKKQHETDLEQFRETLQTKQTKEEEQIRQEARCLKAKYVDRLETIRQTLLERGAEEEARLKRESEEVLERLRKKLETNQKRQEEKIRKENEASLKGLKTKLQKQQAEMKNKLKASNKMKLEELRAQLDDEAEKQRLQKNNKKKVDSFEQGLEEEMKALMKAKRDEVMLRYGRKMAEQFKKERQEHEKKLEQLREKHQKEIGEMREKLVKDCRDEKEQPDVSHALDLDRAEILQRQTETSARESELVKVILSTREELRRSREQRDSVETRLNLLQEKHDGLDVRIRQLEENAAAENNFECDFIS